MPAPPPASAISVAAPSDNPTNLLAILAAVADITPAAAAGPNTTDAALAANAPTARGKPSWINS